MAADIDEPAGNKVVAMDTSGGIVPRADTVQANSAEDNSALLVAKDELAEGQGHRTDPSENISQSDLIDVDSTTTDRKEVQQESMNSMPLDGQAIHKPDPDIEQITQAGTHLSLLDEPILENVEYPISTKPHGLEQPNIIQDGDSDSPQVPAGTVSKQIPKSDDVGKADLEIQSIMEQFDTEEESDEASTEEQAKLPVRTSSLEKVRSASSIRNSTASSKEPHMDAARRASRASSIRSLSFSKTGRYSLSEGSQPMSPLSSPAIHKALPPAPDPDLPFDFHRFLDQLRHRTADPVAKFLRSFLFEFGKKQWMVHEQIKIINDFLVFITGKMCQCEVWKEVSDAEFDNAKEGMEKLVMNRLYSQTYSPAILGPVASPKGKRKASDRPAGPYRRGQHQEDIERDGILAQKIRIYSWVRPEHLDIPKVDEGNERFSKLAQQEILRIGSYRAPRDKVICILNCCKVIFGLLKNLKSADTSADAFIPMLIYVILQANPEHLVSNVQYILRFRNPDKLGGEAGYYVSSLMGAIQFIENLDRTSLTISDEEFEKQVELAVSAIAERQAEVLEQDTPRQAEFNEKLDHDRLMFSQSLRSPNPRSPIRGSSAEKESSDFDEKAAVGGILKSFQRPLTNIGRMFSEEGSSSQYPAGQHQKSGLPPTTPQGLSPSMLDAVQEHANGATESPTRSSRSSRKISAEDAAARQASAEIAEAQRITRAEHKDVVE